MIPIMFVGDNIKTENSKWEFKGHVAEIFDEHVKKSVPLYHEGHNLIVSLSDFFIQDNSICYEIGCSTGNLSYLLAAHHSTKKAYFIGIDKEIDMICKAKEKYNLENLSFINEDIINFEYDIPNFVVSYYALQFINLKHRENIIWKVYNALEKGGCFAFFEKVLSINSNFQNILDAAYFDFKVQNNYSFSEILAKYFSLKGVLVPNTTQENLNILKNVGFKEISIILKYCNFEGYAAIK